MKNRIVKSLLVPVLALSAALVASTYLSAADQVKGAQLLTGATRSTAIAQSPAVAPAHACSQCKTEAAQIVTTEKGHIQHTTTVENHLCGGCKNSVVTRGVGKTAVTNVQHTCSAQADASASCCRN